MARKLTPRSTSWSAMEARGLDGGRERMARWRLGHYDGELLTCVLAARMFRPNVSYSVILFCTCISVRSSHSMLLPAVSSVLATLCQFTPMTIVPLSIDLCRAPAFPSIAAEAGVQENKEWELFL